MKRKWNAMDVVQGYYLGRVVSLLHEEGVFQRLASGGIASTDLGKELGWDPGSIEALLEFVYRTSDLLVRDPHGRYSTRPEYRAYPRLGFHLDKFIGAYGPCVDSLGASLCRGADRRHRLVDRKRLAQAFARASVSERPFAVDVLRECQIRSLLDLGCGPAKLLIEFVRSDPTCQGWGIDASPAMCSVAEQQVAEAGLQERVRIVQGDARRLASVLGETALDCIAAVHCRSLLNEFFGAGSRGATRILRRLRHQLPGRLLFVQDYYGVLTRVRTRDSRMQHTLLQDLAQVASGQGIPPANVHEWAKIYAAAGCRLVHAYEGQVDGVAPFLHIVAL